MAPSGLYARLCHACLVTMTFVHFKNKMMEPCNLSVFVFSINLKITGISSEPTKISLKEIGVSLGPHVETTKFSDMSNWTVKRGIKIVGYISHICPEAPRGRIFTKFCTVVEVVDIITCDKLLAISLGTSILCGVKNFDPSH